jgi:large conductance mechanosensitive channel
VGIIQEFKEFAVKGNAIDMAVGIIIGAAFGKIVNSLVTDVVMPPIGVVLGGVNFNDLGIVLKSNLDSAGKALLDPAGKPIAPVVIAYGKFFNSIIEFLIVAVSVFVMVRVANHLMRMRIPIPIGIPGVTHFTPADVVAPPPPPAPKP